MTQVEAPEKQCTHHWMLTSPLREVSGGICKHCGAVRDFLGKADGSVWNPGRAANRRVPS